MNLRDRFRIWHLMDFFRMFPRVRAARLARIGLRALLVVATLPVLAGAAKTTGGPAHAPAFTLPARSGTACLDSLRAQVVWVDFWASWCQPCRRSFPWMNALEKKYGERGFSVVAINLDKDREAANRFLAEQPASFTIAFDPAGKIAKAYHVTAMPMSFLVGRDGTILRSHAGFDPRKIGSLETSIEQALQQ